MNNYLTRFKSFIQSLSRFPWITTVICLISIGLFIGFHVDSELDTQVKLDYWGATSVEKLWNGDLFGALTCNFFHVMPIHLIFNIYWMFILGSFVEQHLARPILVVLVVTTAFIVSSAELVISTQSGIGLSGIVYSMFGFLLFNQRSGNYPKYLDNRIIQLFIGWLFICILLTKLNVLNIGNAAHFSGFIFGYLAGWILKTKEVWRIAIGIGLVFLSVVPFYYSPWSAEWNAFKGFKHHEVKDLTTAKYYYNKALDIDSTQEMSKLNLDIILVYEFFNTADSFYVQKQSDSAQVYCEKILKIDPSNEDASRLIAKIEIHRLSENAYNLHTSGNFNKARKVYQSILLIDPGNEWAKKNLSILPY